jgi:rhodanese-related sulfurtransferase
MKKRYLYMLPLFLGLLVMFSCSDHTKVYQNADELVAEVSQSVDFIKVETLHAMLDTGAMVLLIDVREPNEYNPGYIPGATNIPRGVIEFKLANDAFWEAQFLYPPLKTDEIILICKKGKRSVLTVEAVKKMGFDNVKVLDGGFKKWELTYPLEQEKNLEEVHGGEAEVGGC